MFQCLKVHNVLTSIVFQSSSSTFFMGKCGAFMLQNLVTMVKRSRAKGSPLYKGEPEGSKVDFRLDIRKHLLRAAFYSVLKTLKDGHEAVISLDRKP